MWFMDEDVLRTVGRVVYIYIHISSWAVGTVELVSGRAWVTDVGETWTRLA